MVCNIEFILWSAAVLLRGLLVIIQEASILCGELEG